MPPPLKYLHYGDMWKGIPNNQYGFGVLKANPYQRGFGPYRPHKNRRRQRGHGFGSSLASIGRLVGPKLASFGRKIGPKVVPLAKKVARRAVTEGIKAIPSLALSQNKKKTVQNLVKNIGAQAIKEITSTRPSARVPKRRKRHRRLKRKGQFTRRR